MQAEATVAVGALACGVRRSWRSCVAPLMLAVVLLAGAWLAVAGRAGAPAVSGAAARAGGLAALSRFSAQAQSVISTRVGAGEARFSPTHSVAGFELSGGGIAIGLGRRGISVSGGGARLSLRFVEIGRGASLWPVDAVAPRARSGRVVYVRGRGVREWYVARPLGIEQGFSLARRPAGGAGAVTLALATRGLRARLAGSGVEFLAGSSRVAMRYGGLAAFDAAGRRLPAWLSLSGSRLLLGVNDRGARYPLRIDPLVQQAELAPAGAIGVGTSVAADGNTVVVGAPNTQIGSHIFQGAVYVYTRSGNTWNVQAVLLANDGNRQDQLGYSVAISGGTIVASAVGATVNGNYYQGAAYVFVRSGAGWTQQAKLTAGDGAYNNWFGNSVAISGDTIVAGAPYEGSTGAIGAAYVFTRSGGIWRQQAELTPPDVDTNCRAICGLGYSVAILGGGGVMSLAAGVPGWEPGLGGAQVGAVYLYTGSGAKWSQPRTLVADDGVDGDGLGTAVAILGTPGTVQEVVAGAPYATVNGQAKKGAVYEFLPQPGSKWSQTKLTAYYGTAGGLFGESLAFSGGTRAVGAPGSNYHVNPPLLGHQGVSYASPGDQQEQKLTASDGQVNDGFGFSLAVSGGILVVGAPNGGPNSNGAAYIFSLPALKGVLSPHVQIHVAGVPRGCATSPVRLRVTLVVSPSATARGRNPARRRAVKVRTVVTLDGRRLLVSSRQAFAITIPRRRLRAGANKLLLATKASSIGTQRIDPNRAWLDAIVIRCHSVRG